MNKFLQDILNPPSSISIKRRSLLTKNQQQLTPKVQQQQELQQINNHKDKPQQQVCQNHLTAQLPSNSIKKYSHSHAHSRLQQNHPQQQQQQQQQYEIEQITQQVIFDEQSYSKKRTNYIELSIRNTQSLGNENYYNLKQQQNDNVSENHLIVQHHHGQGVSDIDRHNVVKNDNNKADKGTSNDNYNQIQSHQKKNPLLTINTQMVEQLVNNINSAKHSYKQFLIWFNLQKLQYDYILSQIMQSIQQKIRSVNVSINGEMNKTNKEQLMIVMQNQHKPLSLSLERKWQIQKQLIKQQLQQRYEYRIQKLQQQLQQQRKFTQHERLNNVNNFNNRKQSYPQQQSPYASYNSNLLTEQLQFVKKQLQEKQAQIKMLQIQNQKLNQLVFDLQQKMQGIQLQVQSRVRERIKDYSGEKSTSVDMLNQQQLNPILEASVNLQQSSKLNMMIGSVNFHGGVNRQRQEVQEIRRQNQLLKSIIQRLERQLTINKQTYSHSRQQIQRNHLNQSHENDTILRFREQQIKQNQQDIQYQWQQIQKQKHSFILRQQELTTAEQNISLKISSLRTKQMQLQKYQTQLQGYQVEIQKRQQQIQMRYNQLSLKEKQLKVKLSQFMVERQQNHAIRLQRQKNSNKVQRDSLSRQIGTNNNNNKVNQVNQVVNQVRQNSRQNLVNNKKKYQQQVNINSRQNNFTMLEGSFRPSSGIEIPELEIGKKYYEQQRNDRSFDNQPRKQHQYQVRQRDAIRHNGDRSFNNDEIDNSYRVVKQKPIIPSSSLSSNFRTARGSHQFVLPPQHNSKQLNHSRSKSKSKQKVLLTNKYSANSNYKTNYKSGGSNKYIEELYNNKQLTNLDGLGSKLQRLRDQIKREIDSIK